MTKRHLLAETAAIGTSVATLAHPARPHGTSLAGGTALAKRRQAPRLDTDCGDT